MKKLLFAAVLAGCAIGFRRMCSSGEGGGAGTERSPIGKWILDRMTRMMERMPENAPPKLIVSLLPRVREQNDQILALLREQNELLRARRSAP